MRSRTLATAILLAALPLTATTLTYGCGGGGGDSLVEPPATPGIGVPVEGSGWEVTLVDAREESSLKGGTDIIHADIYSPKPGFTFLVADVDLRNLKGDRKTALSTDDFMVVGEDGTALASLGFNSRSGVGVLSDRYSMGVTGMIVNLVSDRMKLSLVFAVETDAIEQAFTLQFLEVPSIPFSVRRGPGPTSTPTPAPIPSVAAVIS